MQVRLPDNRVANFPDDMPREEIRARIKSAYPDAFEELTTTGESAPMDDPEGVSTAGMEMLTDAGAKQLTRQIGQGATFGYGDELEAGVRSLFGDKNYDQNLANIRAGMKKFQTEKPDTALIGELVGTLYNPAGYMGLGSKLGSLSQGKQAMIRGAGGGFAYGSGVAEGDAIDRLEQGAVTSAFAVPFSWVAQKLFQGASSTVMKLAQRADDKVSADGMIMTAKQLYKEADLKGSVMDKGAVTKLYVKTWKNINGDMDYNAKDHNLVTSALDMIKRRTKGDLSFQGLDKMRGKVWQKYNLAKRNGDSEQMEYLKTIINDIDDYVDNVPFFGDNAEILKMAREAYKQSQKALALKNVIDKADLQASSTGSGGNTVNAYLQAVKKIYNDPKLNRYFTKREKKVMEEFIKTGAGGGFRRSISKLAPDGNGLMLALHIFGATAIDPSLLIATAVGSGVKRQSESKVQQGVQEIMNTFGGVEKLPPRETNRPAGILGSFFVQEQQQ